MNQKGFVSILVIIGVVLLAGVTSHFIVKHRKASPANPSNQICTQDAMMCPDGSYVGRTGPNCEFAKCPNGSASLKTSVTYPGAKAGGSAGYNGGNSGSSMMPPAQCEVTMRPPTTMCPNNGTWNFVPTDGNCHGSWQCVNGL